MENIEKLDWSWKTIRSTQEHLKYFDASFIDDPTDIFFCHLNEIDPVLIKNVNLTEASAINTEEESDIIIDPRNNSIITNLILDYSENERFSKKNRLFDKFTRQSELTKSQHATCLKVLKFQKLKLSIPVKDQKIFDDIKNTRSEEHKLYKDFVYQHIKSNPNRNILSDVYMNYLSLVVQQLLGRSNQIYSLETGIRLPSNVQTNNVGSLINSNIVLRQGYIAEFNETYDLTKLRNCLPKFVDNWPQLHSSKTEHYDTDNYDIIITDQSLKLLLEPVTDNFEWEIPLKIYEDSNEKITLNFDDPLPLRSINYKTNTYIFKELFKISLNFCNDVRWYKYEKDKMNYFNTNENEEIYAKNLDIDFKLEPLHKYEKMVNNIDLKYNKIFVECDLCAEKQENVKILIKTDAQFCNKDCSYINFSPKLEYYPHFGNTVMTKVELLDEWIQQKLVPNSILKRCRIDANTFEILQIEDISVEQIEKALESIHQINTAALLSSLHDFFNSLTRSFPCGDYILKYSSSHKGKLIIYREKQLKSENVFDLHGIYGNVIQNSQFMQNFDVTPIDDSSYNIMHEVNQIYPCCFPSNGNGNSKGRNKAANRANKNKTKNNSIINTGEKINNNYNTRSQQPKEKSINKIGLPIKKQIRKKGKRGKRNNQKQKLTKIAANDVVKTNKINDHLKKEESKNCTEAISERENFDLDQYLSNFTNNTLTRDEIMEDKLLKKKRKILN